MTKWSDLSNSDLQDWQQNPVTEAMRDVLRSLIDREQAKLKEAYFNGKAAPDEVRLAWSLLGTWHENFFEASLEDVQAVMEKD